LLNIIFKVVKFQSTSFVRWQ